jgi:hypothetical protein
VTPITPREPTGRECEDHVAIRLADGRTGYAIWYPQMGGYCGRAVIADSDGCFDVWIWHDGDFPFNGDDPYRLTKGPRELHHCDPVQFIQFGETVNRLLS